MYCPNCGSSRIRTMETRDGAQGTTRRRKLCRGCGHNFSTIERVEVYVEGQWVQPPESMPDLQLAGPAPAVAAEDETLSKKRQPPRYWPVELEKVRPDLAGLPTDMQDQIVAWWNVARRAKHGTKATWTETAWQLSARRMVSLWHKGHGALVQQLVDEANENGWMALKPEYIRPGNSHVAQAPAPAGLVPRNAAMQQAVETWDNSAA
jgi:hypothetical protein